MLEDQEENIKDDVEYIHVHQDVIDSVQDKMPEEETLYDLAELFKIFGDSTRIRILYVLFESEMYLKSAPCCWTAALTWSICVEPQLSLML